MTIALLGAVLAAIFACIGWILCSLHYHDEIERGRYVHARQRVDWTTGAVRRHLVEED
jgi:hypothetical protein